MKTAFQLSLMLFLLSSVGFAADTIGASAKTGNDLLPPCSLAVDAMDNKALSTKQSLEAVNCLQYLAGFVDGYVFGGLDGKPIVCIPSDVPLGQILRIVVKWMKEHPEKLNQPAPACVLAALYSAFPCKTSK